MSAHVQLKREVYGCVTDTDDVNAIIDRCALNSVDKQILTMLLAEHRDEGFVADTLGYSCRQLQRRFAAALPTFASVAKRRGYM